MFRVLTAQPSIRCIAGGEYYYRVIKKAVAILPSMAIYPQRLFCRELFVIGQS